MSELTEYFVRHYTLVLDNDSGTYDACREVTRAAIRAETPDITLSQYLAMTDEARNTAYASAIGDGILSLIDEWIELEIGSESFTVGQLLIREIMITNGSDLAWSLGKHYVPEDSDAEYFILADDADDE